MAARLMREIAAAVNEEIGCLVLEFLNIRRGGSVETTKNEEYQLQRKQMALLAWRACGNSGLLHGK